MPETASSGQSLIICRNKHWKYISSFHGPWLQLPLEILESLAHQNYTMPVPRMIDAAVFYDVVKIRKLVDEAAQDSVRASTGVSQSAGNRRMDFLGSGGGNFIPLSKERVFKIRQKAVRLSAKAYALDEVAASVAVMQATSAIEDVGSHVLKREPSNLDAKYVHFFHEKIPSRAMAQFTTLEPLSEIIASTPMEEQAAPLRTRALVQIFKGQCEGAVLDLTLALRITEDIKRVHKPGQQKVELASRLRNEQDTRQRTQKDWRSAPFQKEEEQPRSLEMQLLFNRAGAYLTIACDNVNAALDGLQEYKASQGPNGRTGEDLKAQYLRLEARKKVKSCAKRALKDYTAFLSHFDYTPGLSIQTANEIWQQVHTLANRQKSDSSTFKRRLSDFDPGGVIENAKVPLTVSTLVRQGAHITDGSAQNDNRWSQLPIPKIYRTSDLFAERPPADLPHLFTLDTTNAALKKEQGQDSFGNREAVTYHPLLTDALHSLLLAHALVQTNPTELLRYAHNVARLVRIADGYPLFHAARSPARADWVEVLRRANNWVGLSSSWQNLCAPAPLPGAGDLWVKSGLGQGAHRPHMTSRPGSSQEEETFEQRRERVKRESIIDALSDDRVVDEVSFQRAVLARETRARDDECRDSASQKDKPVEIAKPHQKSAVSNRPSCLPSDKSGPPSPLQWSQDEFAKEYLISTQRAHAIARWIRESPLSLTGAGGVKKKRPACQRRKSIPIVSNGAAADTANVRAMGGLSIVEAMGVDDRPD